MKTWTILGSGLCMAALAACSSSSSVGTGSDAGKPDTGSKNDTGTGPTDSGKPTKDAAKDTGSKTDGGTTGDTGTSPDGGAKEAGVPTHVLVTYAGTNPSTMFAVNLATGHVDGTLTTTDSEAITDTANGLAPFLLNQTEDVVTRVDPTTWKATASWSVKAPGDASTGGSDTYAIVRAGGTSAYVLRYLSNVIDVIDTTATGDAGVATSSIDLSSLLQSGDADGVVEVTAGFYDATRNLVYVVLGNVNRYATDDYMGTYDTICVGTTSTLVAIDTTTNTLKNLGGTGMGGGIALIGYDPTSIAYDGANDRVLIMEAGCNSPAIVDGGAPGPLKGRGIEAVELAGGTSAIILHANSQGFPGSFVYINQNEAVVGFSYPTYVAYPWNPTMDNLGAPYANAPNVFDYDGNGNIVGATISYGADGGESTDVTSMSITTGMATKLASNVIPPGTGYVGSVGVWPRP